MADIYRKSSIEKLSNPEQLDRAIEISSPMSWLALLGVVVIIVATIIWSIFGTLPTTVSVNGVIVKQTDAGIVFSDYSGTVVSVLKKAGDSISKGDVVARIKTANDEEKDIIAKESGIVTSVLVSAEKKAPVDSEMQEPIYSETQGSYVYTGSEVLRYSPSFGESQIVVCYVPAAIAGQIKKDMKVLLYPTSVDTQKNGHMEATVETVGEYAVNIANMGLVLGEGNQVAQQFAQGPVVAVLCNIKTDSSTKSGYWWSGSKGESLVIPNETFVEARIVIDESAPITKLFNGLKNKLED